MLWYTKSGMYLHFATGHVLGMIERPSDYWMNNEMNVSCKYKVFSSYKNIESERVS